MLLFLFRQKVVTIFRRKKKIIAPKHVAVAILWSALQGNVILCTFLKKIVTITQKVIKVAKSQQKMKSLALSKH